MRRWRAEPGTKPGKAEDAGGRAGGWWRPTEQGQTLNDPRRTEDAEGRGSAAVARKEGHEAGPEFKWSHEGEEHERHSSSFGRRDPVKREGRVQDVANAEGEGREGNGACVRPQNDLYRDVCHFSQVELLCTASD